MDTITSNGIGQSAAIPHATHGAREPSLIVDRNLRRIWNYRRVLRSPLFHPFHKVLQPLVRWVFASHLFVYDESRPDSPISVNLKPLTISILAMSVVLAPLIFVIILPLVLILVPAGVFFAMLGLVSSSFQADEDVTEHHSLAWHAIH